MATIVKRIDPATLNLKEQVVAINRVTKVVKGGKNLSFSALVVIGDPGGEGGRLRRGQGQGSAGGHQARASKRPRRICARSTCWKPPSPHRCWAVRRQRRRCC
jgi:hypothetical protein